MSLQYIFLLSCVLLSPALCSEWSYKLGDPSGPDHWQFACKGDQQSPVNIPSTGLTSTVFPALSLWNYQLQPAESLLLNNGHSAKLATEPAVPADTPLLSGGGLPNSYKFAQIHFHWGAEDSKGSEHLVGDTQYPMEMHFVHYKAVHDNIGDALGEGAYDSLAVIGIFFEGMILTIILCIIPNINRFLSREILPWTFSYPTWLRSKLLKARLQSHPSLSPASYGEQI